VTQNNNQKSDDLGVSFETPVVDVFAKVPVNDPNVILPTFKKNVGGGVASKMRSDVKVQPVIMRSFHQDLKEAVLRDREKRQGNKDQGPSTPIVIEPRIPKMPKTPIPPAPRSATNLTESAQVVAPIKTGQSETDIEKEMVFVEKKTKPFIVTPSDVTFHAQNKVEPVSTQSKEFKSAESEWIAKPGAAPIQVQFVGPAPMIPVMVPQPQFVQQQYQPQPQQQFQQQPQVVQSQPQVTQQQPQIQSQTQYQAPQPQIIVQNIEYKVDPKDLQKKIDSGEIKIPGFYRKPADVPSTLVPPSPTAQSVVSSVAKIPVPPVPVAVSKKEELITTGFPKTKNSVIVNIPIIKAKPIVSVIPSAPAPVLKHTLPPAPVFVSKKEELITTGFPKTKNPVVASIPIVRMIPVAPSPKEELIPTGFPKTKNPVIVNIPIIEPVAVKQPISSRPVVVQKPPVAQPTVKILTQHFVPVGFRGSVAKSEEKKVEPVVERPVSKPFTRPVDKPVAKHFIKPLEQRQEVKPELVVKPIEKPEETKFVEKPFVATQVSRPEKSHLPSIAEIHKEIQSIQEKTVVPRSKIEIYVTAEDLKTLKSEVMRMDAEIKTFSAQLQSAIGKRTKVLEEKNTVQDESRKIQEVLSIVERKEEEIKNNIRVLENEEETATTADERHEVEEKRWKEEDGRAGIEKKKWEVNVLREKNVETIKDKTAELSRTEQSIEEFNKRITALVKQRDEKKIKIRLGDVEAKKKEIEDIQVSLLEEKRRLSQLLATLEIKEEDLLKKRKLADDLKKKQNGNIAEVRAYEMSRHEIEKHLREAEQKRWESEKALEKISEKIERSNEHYNTVMKIRDEVQGQLSEYLLEE
jgi:hypothetical protein